MTNIIVATNNIFKIVFHILISNFPYQDTEKKMKGNFM